jgi:superfamily I DNA and RNA helicase
MKPLSNTLADRFELVPAKTASAVVRRSADARPWLVLDSVDNMDGLERLIVICVDLDRVISSDADVSETRSRLYRAMTRAELAVAVVNVALPGGWLEFLAHIELDPKREFWGLYAEEKQQARKSADDVVREASAPAGENPGRERLDSAGHEESKGGTDTDAETRMKKLNSIWDTKMVTRARRRNPAYQPFAEMVPRAVPILTWWS